MNNKDIISKLGSIDMDKVSAKLEEKSQRTELIAEAIEICNDNGSLNDTEIGFIEDMEDRHAKELSISEKQYNWLMSIMEKSL